MTCADPSCTVCASTLRDRYDAGESLAELAKRHDLRAEDVFALVCLARDRERGKVAPPVLDGWRIRWSST